MKRTPSVCVIAHAHPDFSKGGGEMAAYRQFVTMRSEGWRCWYVAASDLADSPAVRAQGGVLAYNEDEHLFGPSGMAEDQLYWADAGQRAALVDFLAGLGADVYHFHHYWRVGPDLILELSERRPEARIVLTMHEMLAICAHHGQMVRTKGRELCRRESPVRCVGCFRERDIEHFTLRKAYLLSTLRRCDAVLYPSEFIRARYEEWGLKPPYAAVLENYLGNELMRRPRGTGRGGAASFGFFGQPTEFKGLDILLRGFALALREEETLSLSIFGCEQEDVLRFFPSLEKVIEEVESNIVFYGRYDVDEVLDLMGTVGWVVMPSIWWENSPVVIQEAKRAGTPLIVSDIGGMAEKVVPGVDGLHFKRGSPADLSRMLRHAAQAEVHAALRASITDSVDKESFLAGLAEAYGVTRASGRLRVAAG